MEERNRAAGEGHGARIRRLARPGSSVHVFRQLNSAWGMKLDADPKRYFYNELLGRHPLERL